MKYCFVSRKLCRTSGVSQYLSQVRKRWLFGRQTQHSMIPWIWPNKDTIWYNIIELKSSVSHVMQFVTSHHFKDLNLLLLTSQSCARATCILNGSLQAREQHCSLHQAEGHLVGWTFALQPFGLSSSETINGLLTSLTIQSYPIYPHPFQIPSSNLQTTTSPLQKTRHQHQPKKAK